MNIEKKGVLEEIRGNLIVSCQALPGEPLYSSFIMGKMACAAVEGGARAIRANSVEDILEIQRNVNTPIIGIIKEDYPDSDVYITPTLTEVDALVNIDVEVIALDATNRLRPDNVCLDEFWHLIKDKYPDQLFMADCSNYDEMCHAEELGFDIISTTLSGYTKYTETDELPNLPLLARFRKNYPEMFLIAEGGIWTIEDLRDCFYHGADAAVVGTAITRPMEITKRFVQTIENMQVDG